jgi:hypothetical protein
MKRLINLTATIILSLGIFSYTSCKSGKSVPPKVYQGKLMNIVKTLTESKLTEKKEFTYSEETGLLAKLFQSLPDGSSQETFYSRNFKNVIIKDSTIQKTKSGSTTTFINTYTTENEKFSSVKSLNTSDKKTKEYRFKYGSEGKIEKIGLWQTLGANSFETGKAQYTWKENNVSLYFENLEGGLFEEYQIQYGEEITPESIKHNKLEFGLQFQPEFYSKNIPNGILTKYRNERFKVEVEKDDKNRITQKITSKLVDGKYQLFETIVYSYY